MQNSGKKRVKEPVVDEDELHDWIVDNVDTGGFSHPSVSIDEWYDEEETIPKIITITLSYKTGDGIDQPYSDCPPDEAVIKVFEEHGWNWETEGIMKYGLFCSKCEKIGGQTMRNGTRKNWSICVQGAKPNWKKLKEASGFTEAKSWFLGGTKRQGRLKTWSKRR